MKRNYKAGALVTGAMGVTALLSSLFSGCGNGNSNNVKPTNTPNYTPVVRTVEQPTYSQPTPEATAGPTATPYPILMINRYTDDPAINFSSRIFSDGRLEHRFTEGGSAYECSGEVSTGILDQMRGNLNSIDEERRGSDASFWTDFVEFDINGMPVDRFTYTGGLVVTDRGIETYRAPETVRQLANAANNLGPYPGVESPIATNCSQVPSFERF